MTDNTFFTPTPEEQPAPPTLVENSTDATRGEPLAMRAQKRRHELEGILANLPAEDRRARSDIQLMVASIDALLTGDVDHLSDATAAALNKLLENGKHIAEVAPATDASAQT